MREMRDRREKSDREERGEIEKREMRDRRERSERKFGASFLNPSLDLSMHPIKGTHALEVPCH